MVWGKGTGSCWGKSEYEAVDNMCRFTFFLKIEGQVRSEMCKGTTTYKRTHVGISLVILVSRQSRRTSGFAVRLVNFLFLFLFNATALFARIIISSRSNSMFNRASPLNLFTGDKVSSTQHPHVIPPLHHLLSTTCTETPSKRVIAK